MRKTLFTLFAVALFTVSLSLVGCEAEGEIDGHGSIPKIDLVQ